MFKLNSKQTKTANVAILLASVILGSTQMSMAQSPIAQATTTQPGGISQSRPVAAMRPIKRFTGAQRYMYSTVTLKEPVSLRDLPQYPGQNKFTGGLNYSQLKTGQCYLMRYVAKESSREVMELYKHALIQAGWKINERQTNAMQMTAAKGNGLYCTFCVFPSCEAGYKTQFEIKYLYMGALQIQ